MRDRETERERERVRDRETESNRQTQKTRERKREKDRQTDNIDYMYVYNLSTYLFSQRSAEDELLLQLRIKKNIFVIHNSEVNIKRIRVVYEIHNSHRHNRQLHIR